MIQIDSFAFYNADNMDIMKQYPDKYFDLAIVDDLTAVTPKKLQAKKATEAVEGIVQIADNAVTAAGASNSRAVSPQSLIS